MAKILFIEDEEFLMESFILALKDANHNLTLAKSGEEAIRYLRDHNFEFDLIILDIMLPRGHIKGLSFISEDIKSGEMGFEVLRQLREELEDDIPVIVITAVMDNELKLKVLELGVEKYFTKPISLKDFLDEVDKALPQK